MQCLSIVSRAKIKYNRHRCCHPDTVWVSEIMSYSKQLDGSKLHSAANVSFPCYLWVISLTYRWFWKRKHVSSTTAFRVMNANKHASYNKGTELNTHYWLRNVLHNQWYSEGGGSSKRYGGPGNRLDLVLDQISIKYIYEWVGGGGDGAFKQEVSVELAQYTHKPLNATGCNQ